MQGEGQENIEGSENKTTWHKLLMIRALKSFYNIITNHLITRRSTIIITIETSYSELHHQHITSSPGEAGGEGFLKKLLSAQ